MGTPLGGLFSTDEESKPKAKKLKKCPECGYEF